MAKLAELEKKFATLRENMVAAMAEIEKTEKPPEVETRLVLRDEYMVDMSGMVKALQDLIGQQAKDNGKLLEKLNQRQRNTGLRDAVDAIARSNTAIADAGTVMATMAQGVLELVARAGVPAESPDVVQFDIERGGDGLIQTVIARPAGNVAEVEEIGNDYE